MRKLFVSVLTVLILGASAASAQTVVLDTTPTTNYYAGASLGFVGFRGAGTADFAGHFGIQNILTENLDARFDINAYFSGSFGINANALYNFAIDANTPIEIYVGGGPELVFGGGTAFGIGLRGGATYHFSPAIGGFAELRVDPLFAGGGGTLFGLALGAKYYF